MASQLLMAAATPSTATAATTITTAAAANNTTSRTSTSPASTIFSLTEDDLREIFLRLPDLPTLVRAALTCRPWLGAVRSSRPFLPLCRSDPVVNAALRRGDFFLTSLPPSPKGWSLADCRDGYVLLWNGSQDRPSVAALNPITWAVDVLPPVPGEMVSGTRRDVSVLGFHLVSSEESPWSFRVTCVCTDRRRVRAAVFSSNTSEWAIGPWVRVGGYCSLKYMAGTLVGGSVFWPCHGEARMVRIHTATMDVSFVDLPPGVHKSGHNIGIGETKSGELCIVYASDFTLHVWIRRPSMDGTEIWAPPTVLQLDERIDQLTHASVLDMQLHLKIVQGSFDGVATLYNMGWPPCLVGDGENIGHE